MGFMAFFGTMVLAGIIGYVSEKYGYTRNGIIQSMIICIGGSVLFYMVSLMFGIRFGSAGVQAIVASIGSLILVPTHYRGRKK